MKVTITGNGYLVLTAETSLESYALGKWSDDSLVSLEQHPKIEIREMSDDDLKE